MPRCLGIPEAIAHGGIIPHPPYKAAVVCCCVRHTTGAVAITDGDALIIYISRQAAGIIGRALGRILEITIGEFRHAHQLRQEEKILALDGIVEPMNSQDVLSIAKQVQSALVVFFIQSLFILR